MKKIMEIEGIPFKLITAGHIKVGEKGELKESGAGNKFRLPQKLKYFKITTTERGEDENLIEDERLTSELINSGQCHVDSEGRIVGIPVRLLYDDINLNFPHRMASYKGGNLVCEGNGRVAWSRVDDFKNEKVCPCHKFDKAYTENDKCKYAGTLTMMLDAATLYGQAHKFTTTGRNSVEGLVAGIRLIMLATAGRIAGLPLMLTMNNLSTTTPTGIHTTVPVVGLCYRGNQLQMRDECINLIESDKKFAIDMKLIEANAYKSGGGVVVDDDNEHQKEFHPDSAQHIKSDVIDAKFTEKTETVTKSIEDITKLTVTVAGSESDQPSPDEQKGLVQKSAEDLKKETDQEAILLRLKKMTDQVKAVALMKRLATPYLLKYLEDFNPSCVPEKKLKKPQYVAIAEDFIGSPTWEEKTNSFVAPEVKVEIDDGDAGPKADVPEAEKPGAGGRYDGTLPFIEKLNKMGANQSAICEAIRAEFPEYPLNGTVSPSMLIDQARKFVEKRLAEHGNDEDTRQITPELEKAIEDAKSKQSDNGGTIVEEFKGSDDPFPQSDQRYFASSDDPISVEADWMLLAAKKKGKKIDNDNWKILVKRFKDSGGNIVNTAVELTHKQVQFLLELAEVEPPF